MNEAPSSRADNGLFWRVEEACRAAWPAESETVVDGWLLRRSGGQTRRTNSVNPLPGRRGAGPELFDAAEAHYRRHGQVPIFRVTDFAPDLSRELHRRGYSVQAQTLALKARFDRPGDWPADGVRLSEAPERDWMELRDRLAVDPTIFRDMVARIRHPKAFAFARAEGRTVAIAFGVVVNGLLVVESVATHPNFRGRGLARRVVGALMNWAWRRDAAGACLQVLADNEPALAAYAALGFDAELYRYHYRFAPDP
ncbi:GNAT family N-acetyltransferase [Mesorhizobium sp. SP-1A]|uniref:GNAT family N-acetyltransferase n=1 Tax=Mesorhizobium sp. SP-1A TaxID=3077840 RepID=UPI0028F70060|nr:GNAT family N-acetyltransferase [Mesorhizobium sp. SP-1A]